MKTWGRKLRACHDSFSSRVLDLIPCPLFIIGGACAWGSYTKAIPESSKLVSFLINEDVNVQYSLEFNTAGLIITIPRTIGIWPCLVHGKHFSTPASSRPH